MPKKFGKMMQNAENETLGQIDSNPTQKSLARCFYNPSGKKGEN